MTFIKNHWFGLITGLIIFCFLCLFILVLISPRQDEDKRGFIPCTEAMADKMLACPEEGKAFCMLKAVLGNSWCDAKVIGRGVKNWVTGKQSAPWSNYIFIPRVPVDQEDEHLQEYYKNNPNIGAEMQELKELNKELENESK